MDNSNSYENELLLCSKCGEIPEIIKIHTDNSKIEFNCKICGKYEILIDEHYDELSKNKFSSDENNSVNNREFYCFDCKKTCNENHSNHNCIEIDEKKRKCLEHNENFQYFCFECRKNLCTIEKKNSHKNHKTIEIKDLTKSLIDNQKKIDDINDALQNIIEFNETILNKAEIFKNEDFYVNSIKNMGKSLEEAKDRNSKDIKCLFNGLSEGIQNSLKAFDYFIDQKKIHLHRDDKCLQLNNQKLVDKDFKCITQISFNQLKEIDISENKIKNIQSFKKMSLPFLEFLNLSHNEIDKIEPITKINSKELEYLFLQKNHIEDIETFLDSNFEKIKLLRVEDYNTNFSNQNFNDEVAKERIEKKRIENLNKIKSKYPEGFIYKSIDEQKKEFKKKYELDYDISWDNEFINLPDLKGGQKMLKALFLIITYMPKNNINKLILRNNDIKDPSMLKWVNFNKLETLDLAVNKINHLTFLLEMKAENLKYLYLDNNEFKEIHQIINSNFPKLEVLSINENDFDSFEMKDSPIFKKLKKKNIKIEKKEKVEK
jgi:Leucine-rich repeat (LRR) protein